MLVFCQVRGTTGCIIVLVRVWWQLLAYATPLRLLCELLKAGGHRVLVFCQVQRCRDMCALVVYGRMHATRVHLLLPPHPQPITTCLLPVCMATHTKCTNADHWCTCCCLQLSFNATSFEHPEMTTMMELFVSVCCCLSQPSCLSACVHVPPSPPSPPPLH